jgi:hypothetical protein
MASITRRIRKDIGEGRSKAIYIEPTVDDTAVLLCFFNPARFKRILDNALYIISVFNHYSIPYYCIECVFNEQTPQIPNATVVVRSNSYMFYKELLLNMLEPRVPEKYTKLACIDADVLFDSPVWLDQISKSLNKYDIVQPFSEACWLTPDNTRISSTKLSYGFALVKHRPLTMKSFHQYHPGFAWAFKRDVFRKLGGFYSKSVIGGGDIALILSMFPTPVSDQEFINANHKGKFGEFLVDSWREYYTNFKRVNPKVGCLPIKLFHLFHGVTKDRRYTERYHAISKALTGSWDQEITVNKDGLYEFVHPEINEVLYTYFNDRNEDIPLREAEEITRRHGRRERRRRSKYPSLLPRKPRRFSHILNRINTEPEGQPGPNTLEAPSMINTNSLQK